MDSVKASVKQIVLKDDFIGRQKQLYEQLAHIEKSLNKHHNHKDSHVPRLEDLSRSGSNRKRIKGLRGRQSIFKRPEGPAPRSKIQAVPDYHRNPTKWTYYSLDDVTEMTNESNSAAAFAFLDELKQRKHRESRKQNKIKEKLKVHTEAMEIDSNEATIEDQMDMQENSVADDGPKTVILFCKPQAKKEPPKEDSKPEFRNGKIVMPEYEVGTKKVLKKKKSEKKKLDKIDKKEKLKLDHLEDYEDDEE